MPRLAIFHCHDCGYHCPLGPSQVVPAMGRVAKAKAKKPAGTPKARGRSDGQPSAPALAASSRKKTGGRVKTDGCTWCWRAWSSENPLTPQACRGKRQETLPLAKGYGRRCDICTAAFAWGHAGEDMAEQAKKLEDQSDAASQEHHAAWMITVENYEDMRNQVPFRHEDKLPASRFGRLTVTEEQKVR